MKIKCRCLNCGYSQWIDEDDIEDCENCGTFINPEEDGEI